MKSWHTRNTVGLFDILAVQCQNQLQTYFKSISWMFVPLQQAHTTRWIKIMCTYIQHCVPWSKTVFRTFLPHTILVEYFWRTTNIFGPFSAQWSYQDVKKVSGGRANTSSDISEDEHDPTSPKKVRAKFRVKFLLDTHGNVMAPWNLQVPWLVHRRLITG